MAYFVCYSTGNVGKRNYVVFGNIFKSKLENEVEKKSGKRFLQALRLTYPNDFDVFKNTTCTKFDNYSDAFKEKDKNINKFLKLKYRFKFVEIK